jgi:hypothetical protein
MLPKGEIRVNRLSVSLFPFFSISPSHEDPQGYRPESRCGKSGLVGGSTLSGRFLSYMSQSIDFSLLFKDLRPPRKPEGTLEMDVPVPESFSVFYISLLRGFSERIKGILHED